jgi:3,4-dihydroxy 2-butanone 4-phosphate synthase/GTP cyclohydrolase II
VQTASLARDVFGIAARDATPPAVWLKMIEQAGRGVFLYVVPARARGLVEDIAAPGGLPSRAGEPPDPRTASAPLRDFGLGAQVLAHLGVRTLRLLTNNPRRIAGLEGYGLHVVECVPSRPPAVVLPLRDERP